MVGCLGLCWNMVWVLVCYGVVCRRQGVLQVSLKLLVATGGICFGQDVIAVTGDSLDMPYSGLPSWAWDVFALSCSDFHAAALIYTFACCSPNIPFLRTASLLPRVLVLLVSAAYGCACMRLLCPKDNLLDPGLLYAMDGNGLSLFLTWTEALHWGLTINKGS